ncbi:type VI secretion system tip protein TssI/VgrG [Alcaligenaceae bacterium C4P045]|nr:type VI secretion system tip protein TssI/VgrG [Alcaligenaceae bacterium C4P045]
MNRVVKAHTPLAADQLTFRAMQGHETLSQLFEFDIELLATTHSLDFKQLLGNSITLEIQTSGEAPRFLDGQVARCVLIGRENATSRHYVYRVTVRPWLWYLTQTSDSKIFQGKNIPDVIREVLADYPFVVDIQLSDTYREWEYCVQYQETDFAFISRLMEHEGIYYWFRHELGKHTLVLTDDVTRHPPLAGYETVTYYGADRAVLPQEEHVSHWEVAEQLTPGAFVTNDYHFQTPDAMLESRRNNPGAYSNSAFEVYEWQGGYTNASDAERYTRVRLEDLQCRHEQVSAACNVRGMAPGHLFTLRNHPRLAENREYLIVSARYSIREGGYSSGSNGGMAFDVAFTVLPTRLQFRPPRHTPVPRTHGPQTARVVGKQGEEIYTDQYGRVKVQFHWDRYGRRNENSSCWVRVSSPWASGGFGGIQLPRVGDEVVVDFVGGQPDRPLIIGRVYNAGNMPPWNLPANATQSGFLTRSKDGTPHTANAFMFEDKPGGEEIWLHAEKDQRIEVENDESHWVGHDRVKKIDRDESDKIGRHWKLQTGGFKNELVKLASVQTVGLGKMLNVGMAYNVNVGGLHLRNVGLEMASTVGRDRSDRVVQSWTADVGHTYTVTVRGKAVGDAVNADREKPIDISPGFTSDLPDPVSSSNANQLRMTDTGETSLSGAKRAQLIGPGGTVTIDDTGIRLRGRGIYLEAPIISMSGGDAKPLVPVTEADCAECSKKTASTNPVDVATGQKLLAHEDFSLPGRMPIRWYRSYRSADQRPGALGVAWRLPYSTELRAGATGITYYDADGRQLQFPHLEPGASHFHPVEKHTLMRAAEDESGAAYIVQFASGVQEHYAAHPARDGQWQLQRVTTPTGQSLDLGYTPEGWLCEVRNNVHAVQCTLDEMGRIVDVRWSGPEKGGELTEPVVLARYTYDAQGDLATATDRQGRVWRHTYRHHLLTEYRTPSGAVHVAQWSDDTPEARCIRTYAYDPQASNAQGRPALTRDTRFVYSPAMQLTRVTDALGQTTEFHYNGLWAVDRVMHPDGSVAQIHYDETGSLAGRTDELGRTTRLIKNERGHLTAIVDPAGQVTRVDIDDRGKPVAVTDPAGQVWRRAYDDAGNLLSETDPLGNTTSYTYADGLPVSRRDALGNVNTMQYDAAGLLTAATDCSGHTTHYRYDTFGQLIAVTDPAGRSTQYDWNKAGQMTASRPAGLGAWQATYDAAGRAVAHTDPRGRTMRAQWDAYDQALNVQDPASGRTAFDYDALGRVTRLTNVHGEATTMTYDVRGRVVEQTGFDGRRQGFRYNAAGELVERVDHGQDGQIVTTVVYDALGQPLESHSGDGSRAAYRYDVRGLLTQAQASMPGEPTSQVTYEYDAAGRRTAEVQSHHGRVWRLTHELNAIGKRESTHIPDAGKLTWQRYGSGHVHGVLWDGEPLAAFERDVLHREVARTQGGVMHAWHYNDAGLMAAHDWQHVDERGRPMAAVQRWRTWDYDNAGRLLALRDVHRGRKDYAYDPLARLTSVMQQQPDGAQRHELFHYDPAGNLLGAAAGTGLSATSPALVGLAERDRLLEMRVPGLDVALQYTYDGHGNRIGRSVPSTLAMAAVDHSDAVHGDGTADGGRLKGSPLDDGGSGDAVAIAGSTGGEPTQDTSQDAAPAALPATAATTSSRAALTRYRYDGGHQLIAIEHADGGRTAYRYDALGRRIAKLHQPAGEAMRTTLFVWDGDWMVQELKPDASGQDAERVTYVAHPDRFGPLARIADGKCCHYVVDHLGTPQELYDERRKVVWAADMAAYGEVAGMLASEVDNPIRFPGQYYDAESGLHYNRYRYYDAQAGRYINQDPIGLQGGMNAYAYVQGNPVQKHDPLGLVTWKSTAYQVNGGPLSGTKYTLRSECIDGKRAVVEVLASGGSYGAGLAVGAQGFNMDFKDQLDHIDPNVFNGAYTEGGASITFIKGIGVGSTMLGGAESQGLLTFYNRGYGAGLSAAGGVSKVLDSQMEDCRPDCAGKRNGTTETPTNVAPPPGVYPPTVPPNFMNGFPGL